MLTLMEIKWQFVPLALEAQTEARMLMLASNNILSLRLVNQLLLHRKMCFRILLSNSFAPNYKPDFGDNKTTFASLEDVIFAFEDKSIT